MKGERTLYKQPFRYGGFSHDYEKDVEQWANDIPSMKRCYCCSGRMKNARSQQGTLLKVFYPYAAFFLISKGHEKGRYRLRPLCRACAYDYGVGVIEMDGNMYTDYYDFKESKFKKQYEPNPESD